MKQWSFWLGGIVITMMLVATLSITETSSAHSYKPTHTPTHTPTPTLTPTPVIQNCQVQEIFINGQRYDPDKTITVNAGDPINVTLRVADAAGDPLLGANVDATVTRQDIPSIQAASAVPSLVDQSGTYVGVYTQTETPGDYSFNFRVSDFIGSRFSPCSAEAKVRVEEPPQCDVSAIPKRGEVVLNQPIVLTASVTVSGTIQSGAVVSATVLRPPDETHDGPIPFAGNGPYSLTYSKTDVEGDYEFLVSASSPDGSYQSCTDPDPPIVEVKPIQPITCTITMPVFDKPQYTVGEIINFNTTVDNTNGAEAKVTAAITQPNRSVIEPPPMLTPVGNMMYQGSITATVPGTYEFKVTATDPNDGQNFDTCMAPPASVPVVDIPSVRVAPETLSTTLCSLRETSTVLIEDVSNLIEVQLQLSYDPKVIQVIDADRSQRGVQVKHDGVFALDAIRQNEVDTRNGRIFFSAKLLDGRTANGSFGIIGIDWRPQKVGASSVTLDQAVLIDSSGKKIETKPPRNGAVQVNFVRDCRTGNIQLQGRADHGGAIVTNSAGVQTQTEPDGAFAIIGGDRLTFEFPAYLTAQTNLQTTITATGSEAEAVNLGVIHLLAGDINADNRVDLLDLVYIANLYHSTDPIADLNADGLVDILDLALVAANYQQQGPLVVRP